ncbi:signal peptidase I [Streptomyces axinellae]|uniref:signal peptidase I n=1 Tax=Streptomyces axinellae TaxID=552788 RepID=UPI003CD05EBB
MPSEDDAHYDPSREAGYAGGYEGPAPAGQGSGDDERQSQEPGYSGSGHQGQGYGGYGYGGQQGGGRQQNGQWSQGEGQWTALPGPGFGPAPGYGPAAPPPSPGPYGGSYEYSEPFDYAVPEQPAPSPASSSAAGTGIPVDGPHGQWTNDQDPPPGPVFAEAEPGGETGAPDAREEPALRRPGQGRADRRRAAKRIRRRRRLSATKEIPILIGVALLIALVLKTFLVQAFVIPSGSMEQTIKIGDRVLVDKLTPWFGSNPQRGDVVVFEDPGGWLKGEQTKKEDPPPVIKQGKEFLTFIGLLPSDDEQDLIKRVVGVGGDTVRCCDEQGRVTVNGTPLKEPYLHPGNKPSQIKFKVTVPVGRVFVMGDHRANSADSRYHLKEPDKGMVPERLVQGRALVIAWPFGHWRRLEEPETYASVPDARGAPASASVAPDNRVAQLPFSAELPLVMGVVGLYRYADRRQSGVRSECGGLGGRRTVRFRRPGGQASRRGRRDGERDGRRRATDRGKRE